MYMFTRHLIGPQFVGDVYVRVPACFISLDSFVDDLRSEYLRKGRTCKGGRFSPYVECVLEYLLERLLHPVERLV